MRRKSFQDYRQIQIPFDEAKETINGRKRAREEDLILEAKYFRDHDEERAFLMRITFDITDKDFEYFCEYIAKKHYGLKEYRVIGGWYDGGEDIVGKDEKGNTYSFQCKQWAALKVHEASIEEYLLMTEKKRKEHPKTKFVYITTGYLTKKARETLKKHDVEYINNTKLVQISKKLGLMKEEKWKKLENDIDVARQRHIRGNFVTTPLTELMHQRQNEQAHHFPKYFHTERLKEVGEKR